MSTTKEYVTLDSLLHNNSFLVIYFYPKDDTPGCTRESEDFRDAYSQFLELKTEVVGISNDGINSHINFQKKYGLPFQLLSDHEKNVVTQYEVLKEKKMFGKEYLGVDRSTFFD